MFEVSTHAWRRLPIGIACLIAASSAACSDIAPCDELGSRGGALMRGTPDPTATWWTPAQRRAIGRFLTGGAVRCTGALVTPRHALTARHCFPPGPVEPELTFSSVDARGARARRPVIGVTRHPMLDVALAELGGPMPGAGTEPLRVYRGALSERWVGRAVEVAGAGVGTAPARVAFGVFTLTDLEPTRARFDADGARGVCSGDSGGPILFPALAGGRAPLIIAVTSTGTPSCLGAGWGVRADAFADWLEATLAGEWPGATALFGVGTPGGDGLPTIDDLYRAPDRSAPHAPDRRCRVDAPAALSSSADTSRVAEDESLEVHP